MLSRRVRERAEIIQAAAVAPGEGSGCREFQGDGRPAPDAFHADRAKMDGTLGIREKNPHVPLV